MKVIKAVIFLAFLTVFTSCDQDFNAVGADLVGDEYFDFDKEEISGPDLKAYSVATGVVQTNNLPINPLGFYKHPYFGDTKANFVTQLSMSVSQPKFGTSVQVENVVLYVPYFSTLLSTNSDGTNEYKLDSIYGGYLESKMRLNVYENDFYLNTFDPADQSKLNKYYSNEDPIIDAQKRGHDGSGNSVAGGTRLNDSPNTSENDQFFFNKQEIIIYKTKFNSGTGLLEYVDANDLVLTDQNDVSLRVVKERLAPGIYLSLNKEYFKKKILQADSNDLLNNNSFRSYFKGLYFQVEQLAGQDGAMAMLNFTNAKIDLNYSSIDESATTATSKTFALRMGTNANGNTISLQENTHSTDYLNGLAAGGNNFGNPLFGQNDKLYLKGGNGSVVYLEISQTKINELREKKLLINDAYIEFYIDQNTLSSAGVSKYQEAERLYLFDAKNQRALVDYVFDTSTSTNFKRNKLIYNGLISREASGKGFKYKIRITQHINNILNSTVENANENVKLGLSVTENIAINSNYYFKDKKLFDTSIDDDDIEYFPVSSIMAQQGTVLHGTASSDSDKKLKITIHYTKPN